LKIDANCSLSARWQDFGPLPKSDVLRHNKRLNRLFVPLLPKPI